IQHQPRARFRKIVRRLRIGLRLPTLGTFDISKTGNVQGDEQVARAWQKYLSRCPEIESVTLYDAGSEIIERLDFLIHFNPFLKSHENTKNVLYLQNAFPESHYEHGVVGVFRKVQGNFAGFVFTSKDLMKACTDGAVVPFATDPDVFYPQRSASYEVPVAFVGNDLRGPLTNHRYLFPAV